MSYFSQKVALITGASSGIGAALAQELVSQGAKVVLFARRGDRLQKIAENINHSKENVLVISGDVTQEQDLKRAVHLTREKFKKIDIFIVNAGWSLTGNLEEICLED